MMTMIGVLFPTDMTAIWRDQSFEWGDWICVGVFHRVQFLKSHDLLNLYQRPYRSPMGVHQRTGSESSTLSAASSEYDGSEDTASSRVHSRRDHIPRRAPKPQEKPLDVLQRVPGNGVCADCGARDPDWASLNLGILLCIECSGVHRNLSVQISKVRLPSFLYLP